MHGRDNFIVIRDAAATGPANAQMAMENLLAGTAAASYPPGNVRSVPIQIRC